MACGCGKNKNVQRKSILPRITQRVLQNSNSDLPPFGLQEPTASDTLTTERRRIDKLRREAVRKSLGIG
jgi:hypothetical protein